MPAAPISDQLPRGQAQAEQRLQRRLNYSFASQPLLRQALTHKSFGRLHNERLEFLGDAVLGSVVAAHLFSTMPQHSEATLTMMRAQLVRKESLADVAQALGLGDALLLGVGERNTGGHERASVLADGLEAVFGAIYQDGGNDAITKVINTLFAERYAALDPAKVKDNKTRLQEYLQGDGHPLPEYSVVDLAGAAHEQQFTVRCAVPVLHWVSEGTGTSRRAAEQQAAGLLLARVEDK